MPFKTHTFIFKKILQMYDKSRILKFSKVNTKGIALTIVEYGTMIRDIIWLTTQGLKSH